MSQACVGIEVMEKETYLFQELECLYTLLESSSETVPKLFCAG